MPEIVLATLNARFAHASLGLRYLHANLGELAARAEIVEMDIGREPLAAAEIILGRNPTIVAFGVYIWNVAETTAVIALLRRLRPDIRVIVGGPEVSYEVEEQEICRLADHVVTGEADLTFAALCRTLLGGGEAPHLIQSPVPDLAQIALPYDRYDARDIAHRILYVEASRGCPYECEFCLSALDIPVRQFPLDRFLAGMQSLLDRGARKFKFVDRTFNLNIRVAEAILRFFRERWSPDLFLHFELIPDRLPEPLRELVASFPPGALQFEIGIQTFDPTVGRLISRRQDDGAVTENFRFLRDDTGVHIHADLIFGLPGQTLAMIEADFDHLLALRPQEIQVGILKRLRGTPIIRHDEACGMVYSPHPPYEILQTKLIDFALMQRLKRFAKAWDLVANSGNFVETTPRILEGASAFRRFLDFADDLFAREGRTFGITLTRLAEIVFDHSTTRRGGDPKTTAQILWRDYQRGGRSDRPPFLRPWITTDAPHTRPGHAAGLERQARHRQE